MRTFKIFTAAWFAFSSAFATAKSVEPQPVERAKTPVEVAAELFNAVGTADRLYAFMQVDASPEDSKFIEQLRADTKDNSLPKAYAKEDAFHLVGLEEPLRIVDAKRGLFSYDGRNITLDWSKGFKANYELMEKTIRPKRIAVLDWILPQAHAIDLTTLFSGALIGGGLATMFTSNNSTYQTLGGIAAIGGALMLAFKSNKPKQPKIIDCTGGGMREVLVRGSDGRIYRTVSGYSSPYQMSPGYPTSYSPYMQTSASNVTGLCNSPQSLAQTNYAMRLQDSYRAPSVNTTGNFYNSFALPAAANRLPASTATGLGTQSVTPAAAWPGEESTASK